MHTKMLNIGFSKRPDGTYYHIGLVLAATINPDGTIHLYGKDGVQITEKPCTIDELEDAIVNGLFGAI